MPKQHFVNGVFSFIIEIFGKACRTSSRFLFIFFSFLTSQTPSEDDFSEDEWLKPLPP